jgi:alpha-N-arabinofuranosidase
VHGRHLGQHRRKGVGEGIVSKRHSAVERVTIYTWWPLFLFSKYMRGHTVAVNVQCSEYTGPTEPAWIRGTIETPWLDVSATVSDDKWLNPATVNIHGEKDYEVDIKGTGGEETQVYTMTGRNTDATNTEDEQQVGMKESKWNGKGRFAFPKHSLTILRWRMDT